MQEDCRSNPCHAVVGIAFQQALPLQEASDALCEGLGQPGELRARRCFHPTQPHRTLRALDICPVEEKHVGDVFTTRRYAAEPSKPHNRTTVQNEHCR